MLSVPAGHGKGGPLPLLRLARYLTIIQKCIHSGAIIHNTSTPILPVWSCATQNYNFNTFTALAPAPLPALIR